MRIAFVTSFMQTGGVETNLVGLARELCARGHDVLVVSGGGNLVGDLETAGARHVRMRLRLNDPVALARATIELPRLIERERICIAHSMSAAATLALALAPRRRGCTFLSSPMGLQNSDREPRIVTDLRDRLLVFRIDRVLVISEEIQNALRRIGVPPERMLPCDVVGVDPGSFRAGIDDGRRIRDELGIAADAKVITTIGALHPRKSHDLFLRACREIASADLAARFVIVGQGTELAALQALAVVLGIGAQVTFTGQRRDIAAILAASDVYVKPGVVEGFIGITVLEAMAAGVPVVAFDTRDVRAAITPGQTGLIVPSRDSHALAEGIRRLLGDTALRRALVTRARDVVVGRFDRGTVAAGLEKAYASLASEPCAA